MSRLTRAIATVLKPLDYVLVVGENVESAAVPVEDLVELRAALHELIGVKIKTRTHEAERPAEDVGERA